MPLIKKSIQTLVTVLLFVATGSVIGSPHALALTRTVTMPDTVVAGVSAHGEYTVVNQFGINLSAMTISLPTGASLQTGAGFCQAQQALANGASCIIAVNFSGAEGNRFDDSTIKVCPSPSSGPCSRLNPGHLTEVTRAPTPPPTPTPVTSTITASAVSFTIPGEQTMTLTNEGDAPASIRSVTLGEGIHGVGVGTVSADCQSLKSQQHCTVSLSASELAYGSTEAQIAYSTSQGDASIQSGVSVVNTTLSINNGQTIVGNMSTHTGEFSLENTGHFTWLSPHVSADPTDIWLTLTGCTSDLAPGQSCTITYTITGIPDDGSVITATGTNSVQTSQNFVPSNSITIGIESQDSYQHLGYRAVRVSNLTSVAQTLSNISATPTGELADKVTLCDGTSNNCSAAYASTCSNGHILEPTTGVCYFWYKAKDSTSLGSTDEDVTVSVTANTQTLEKTLHVAYSNDLYAGGWFTNYIAKWNGSEWSALGTGSALSNFVSSFTILGGDLYAGGGFITAAGTPDTNYIAKWDGTTWSALGSGLSGEVYAVTTLNDDLYVGGVFTIAGVTPANKIAKWNSLTSTWSALGTGLNENAYVNALTILDTDVYVGGFFTSAGGVAANNIAKWDSLRSTWLALNLGLSGGVSGIVHALMTLDTDVYVGGSFTTAGVTPASKIAKWNSLTSTWSTLGSSSIQEPYAEVDALTRLATDVYVGGGAFDKIGQIDVFNRAKWDGTTWSPLGSEELYGYGVVLALTTLSTDVYMGGYFNTIGNVLVFNIAKWDSTTSTWSGLGSGLSSGVRALRIAPSLTLSSVG